MSQVTLAAAFPLLFLHLEYQPSFSVGSGGTDLTIASSDLAVLALLALALWRGRRDGFGALRAGRTLWIASALYLGLVVAAVFYPLVAHAEYPWRSNLVTAAKLAEYAALAVSVPLLVRAARDLRPLLAVAVAWSVAMSGVGVLQFLGVVDEFQGRRPGQREPSYVGIEDFGVLSGAVLSIAFVAIVLGVGERRDRRLAWVGAASGIVGLVLSGAVAGVLGIGLAGSLALVVAWRRGVLTPSRTAAVAGCLAAVALGTFAMRSADIGHYLDFLGIRQERQDDRKEVQTYAQRTLMAYIAWQIFLDQPLLGAGFQGSKEPYGYGPQLAAAHERFPDSPPRAFPTPEHPWGPHNLYLQALADTGVLGLATLLALLLAAGLLAATVALRASPETAAAALLALLWLGLLAGIANGRGTVAGIPFDALLWLAAGLAVAARSWTPGEETA